MTAKQAKDEFEKLARESGIAPEVAAGIMQAMENEKFASGVANGFARHAEYSSALDKAKAAEAKAAQYHEWYEKQAVPAMQSANTAITRLQEYEAAFGPIENQRQLREAAAVTGLTKEQMDRALDQRQAATSQAVVEFQKGLHTAAMSHFQRYGEVLDIDDLEKHMRDNRLTDLRAGYQSYERPRAEAKRNEETEARIKKEREDAVRDYRSRNRVIEKSAQPTSVFHDLKKLQDAKSPEGRSDQEAEEAFHESWRENAPTSVA